MATGQWRQRPDLDLSDILPSYREFLSGSSTADINYVRSRTSDDEEYREGDLGWGEKPPSRLYETFFGGVFDEPVMQGSGPIACSTSRVVALGRPAFAWDGNYYYRRLGIPFPYVNATKGDLSRGYLAGDHDDDLAMYALKQLLNPEVRAAYDAMALGEVYLDDVYVQNWLKARAAADASRRTQAMRDAGQDVVVTPKEVLDEWGYQLEPNTDLDLLDSQGNLVEDRDRNSQNPDQTTTRWAYAYWSWRASWRATWEERLERWQSVLVTALSEAGLTLNLAVGIMDKQPQQYAVSQSGDTWVIYLHDEVDPTTELAAKATSALTEVLSKNRDTRDTTP